MERGFSQCSTGGWKHSVHRIVSGRVGSYYRLWMELRIGAIGDGWPEDDTEGKERKGVLRTVVVMLLCRRDS